MAISRRELLAATAGLTGLAALSACGGAHTKSVPPTIAQMSRHAYGADPSQFGELHLPTGTPRLGTVVVIHGGFWRSQYDLSLGTPLAEDLAVRGYVAFNLEYRRVGNGGGWPTTLQDVASGIDQLAALDVDVSKVVAIGHSAGGQLAAWAAGRAHRPAGTPGADPKVAITGVVSQAGVLDLLTAQAQGVGGTAVSDLLGGTPATVPQRYAAADPIEQLPLTAPVLCVHSQGDQNVPYAQSTAYVSAATKAGGRATLTEVTGDHFTLIDPTSKAWATVIQSLPGLFAA